MKEDQPIETEDQADDESEMDRSDVEENPVSVGPIEQSSADESEDLLTSARLFFSEDRTQQFLIGFLFGVAFFLVGAGLGEVLLARNKACIDRLAEIRLAPSPTEACMSEFQLFLARSMSKGLIGTLSSSSPTFGVWFTMAIIYGLIGGGFAQFSLRTAIVGFLLVHIALMMVSMSLDYLSQFIILDPAPG